MRVTLILLAVITIIAGFLDKSRLRNLTETPSVLSETNEHSPSPTPTHSPTITPTPRPIAATPTATPVLPKETPVISNSSWIYPNANIIETSGGTIILRSSDSADTITEWYKTLIRQSGVQVKSFVQTKTNGVVLNKLVAAGNNKQTRIEISQKPGESVIIAITGLE